MVCLHAAFFLSITVPFSSYHQVPCDFLIASSNTINVFTSCNTNILKHLLKRTLFPNREISIGENSYILVLISLFEKYVFFMLLGWMLTNTASGIYTYTHTRTHTHTHTHIYIYKYCVSSSSVLNVEARVVFKVRSFYRRFLPYAHVILFVNNHYTPDRGFSYLITCITSKLQTSPIKNIEDTIDGSD